MRRDLRQRKKPTQQEWKNDVNRQRFKNNLLGIGTIIVIIVLYCKAKGFL